MLYSYKFLFGKRLSPKSAVGKVETDKWVWSVSGGEVVARERTGRPEAKNLKARSVFDGGILN